MKVTSRGERGRLQRGADATKIKKGGKKYWKNWQRDMSDVGRRKSVENFVPVACAALSPPPFLCFFTPFKKSGLRKTIIFAKYSR